MACDSRLLVTHILGAIVVVFFFFFFWGGGIQFNCHCTNLFGVHSVHLSYMTRIVSQNMRRMGLLLTGYLIYISYEVLYNCSHEITFNISACKSLTKRTTKTRYCRFIPYWLQGGDDVLWYCRIGLWQAALQEWWPRTLRWQRRADTDLEDKWAKWTLKCAYGMVIHVQTSSPNAAPRDLGGVKHIATAVKCICNEERKRQERHKGKGRWREMAGSGGTTVVVGRLFMSRLITPQFTKWAMHSYFPVGIEPKLMFWWLCDMKFVSKSVWLVRIFREFFSIMPCCPVEFFLILLLKVFSVNFQMTA